MLLHYLVVKAGNHLLAKEMVDAMIERPLRELRRAFRLAKMDPAETDLFVHDSVHTEDNVRFEVCRHGLKAQAGYFFGTERPGLADLTVHILWGTMTAKLLSLRPMLDATAPAIAGLSDRIAALPEQTDLRARSNAEYGNDWCGGQIEASLRAVL